MVVSVKLENNKGNELDNIVTDFTSDFDERKTIVALSALLISDAHVKELFSKAFTLIDEVGEDKLRELVF